MSQLYNNQLLLRTKIARKLGESIQRYIINTRIDSVSKHALKCMVLDTISRNSCMEC